jgi:hypothetical protein
MTSRSGACPGITGWRSIAAWGGLLIAVLCGAVPAQPRATAEVPSGVSPSERASANRLAAEALAAFGKGDYVRAETLLRKQLELDPGSFVALYNLGCCRAMQGDADGACTQIAAAIENGFCDRRQLEQDPTLAAAREHPKFKAMLDNWPEILDARRRGNEIRAEAMFKGREYVNASDDRLRLSFRSAFNEKAFGEARAEIDRIARWADAELFSGILDPEAMKQDAWAMIVLPSRPDYMKWVVSVYGADAVQGNSMVGGAYEHDEKRLVSMDIGATLRHEFMHVLHWRSCTRLGQIHPIWIMEGLCSLVEDYDIEGNTLRPATSWRTNMAQRMERVRNLMPIEKMATLPPLKFTGPRPLANYAQARAFFLFLYERGKLKDWYRHYTAHFADDPTGVKSIEAAMEEPIDSVDRSFKAWLRALPPVPEIVKSGTASLGVEVDSGTGEGPVVTAVVHRDRTAPDRQNSLRKNDVITSVGGRAVRDIAELVRVLSGLAVGDDVEVEYRRGRTFGTTTVRLVPR